MHIETNFIRVALNEVTRIVEANIFGYGLMTADTITGTSQWVFNVVTTAAQEEADLIPFLLRSASAASDTAMSR